MNDEERGEKPRETVVSIKTSSADSIHNLDTETSDWKNVIFLPFNKYWESIIALTILLSFLISLNDLYFKWELQFNTWLYYIFEVLFFVNTICLIMHSKLVHHRKKRYYHPVNTTLITISVLTLLPLYEIYYVLNVYSWDYHSPKDHTKLKCSLRLINLYMFLRAKRIEASLNNLRITVFNHMARFVIILPFLCVTWSFLGDMKKPNWREYMEIYTFEKNNTKELFLLYYSISINMFSHNWIGTVGGKTVYEKAFIVVVILVGFICHMMLFFGELTFAFLESYRHQFLFTTRLKKIIYMLDDWHVDAAVKKKTIEYYEVFWERRLGMKRIPEFMHRLPVSLRKEVQVDIFWESLRHSHLFVGTDMAFKRAVSTVMNNEFLLPGDYLYRNGEVKTKMVYIVSGVLQILSNEDNESPIISFSSGSVLGEMACLFATKCKANVKCATYCELQTIDLFSLCNVLKDNRSVSFYFFDTLLRRISDARFMRDRLLKHKVDLEKYKNKDTHVTQLKRQWRNLIILHTSKKQAEERAWAKLDKSICSRYMDLLVLSDDLELKVEAICLTSSCPFIMDPNTSFRRFCEYMVLTSVVLQVVILPYLIFMENKIPDAHAMRYCLFVLDALYYFDIYLQMTTAVKMDGKLITNAGEVIMHRVKQTAFLFDVIASLPYTDIFSFFEMANATLWGKTPRMIKVYKIFMLLIEKEANLWVSFVYIRLLKYFLLTCVFIYLVACGLYTTSCFMFDCRPGSWILAHPEIELESQSFKFKLSLMYALSLFLSLGCTDNFAHNLLDIAYATVVCLIGYFLYSFALAELTASSILHIKKLYAHRDETMVMKRIMKRRLVPAELYALLMNILEFNWLFNEGAEIQGKNGILNDASTKIHNEIINERIVNCMKLVPMFRHFNNELINCLSTHMEVTILPPGTHILNINYTPLTVYIILRGYCQMSSTLPGDKERQSVLILKRGDMLAPLEVLHRLKMFGSIESISAVEIMKIPYHTFNDILRSHRSEYRYIESALEQHLKLYENILMRKGCRLPHMTTPSPSLGKVDSFTYKVFDNNIKTVKEEQHVRNKKQSRKTLCHYLLLRWTIDPNKKFFIVWEAFRITLSIVDILLCLLTITLLTRSYSLLDVVISVLKIVPLVDIYIRMHCQYYNDNGILVTDSWCTAKHYLKTSFTLDLIPTIPSATLKIPQLIAGRYYLQTKIIIRIILKTIQLHRFYNCMSYVQKNMHWTRGCYVMMLKYSVFVLIMLGILTNFTLLLTCVVTDKKIDCSSTENWFSATIFKNKTEEYMLFVEAFYLNVALFTNSLSGTFGVVQKTELDFMLCLVVFLYLMRLLMLASFTSSAVGGNINLSIYQARVKQFLKFADQVKLDETLVKEVVDHYEYVWKETHGTSITNICEKFNQYLRTKFVCFLYEPTLRMTTLFSVASPALLQSLTSALVEVHFKKDAHIIRCNDVQSKLYIVYRGRVHISIANMVLSVLDAGGMFGCFSRTGILRQTITAKADRHTILLSMESRELHKIMAEWQGEQSHKIIRDIKTLKLEYIDPIGVTRSAEQMSVWSFKYNKGIMFYYSLYIKKVNQMINQESKLFWFWEYMINVHCAVISSITVLINVCLQTQNLSSKEILIVIYAFDLLFLSKILCGFSMAYIDPSTGIQENNPKKICKRYLKSIFWFDLITCLPFELAVPQFLDAYDKLATLNRAFRYYYMSRYYSQCSYKLTISKHLRLTFLLYRAFFLLQLMANIWIAGACFSNQCEYVANKLGRPRVFKPASSPSESVVLAYLYIINCFTSTGLRDVSPKTIKELLVSILILLFVQFVITTSASGFISMIIIENNTMSNFRYNIFQMKIYLKGRHLSVPIFNKAWEYLLQLWKMQRGEWMPFLICTAPSYIKQDIMSFLYMSHLENHFLFAKTHKDFLRQLVVHFETCVYLPGNYIVEQGDIENAMYFIHRGEVGAFDRSGSNETECFMLSSHMTFGEAQGLYHVPYNLSYKALTTVVILALKKSDWDYLLKWFPASEEVLRERSNEYGLLMGTFYSSQDQLH